VTIR
jgi:hypothetical protein